MIKVLNLYAGIGGNRMLWKNVDVTAVEINEDIARIYFDFFPNDKIVVGDAHDYLIEHYKEFDFIWSSPPCQTHSKTIYWNHIHKRYPDMRLWQEIIFLKHFCKVHFVVENVNSYYEPLIKPNAKSRRHWFWSNFDIPDYTGHQPKVRNNKIHTYQEKMKQKGIIIKDFHDYIGDKRQLINNAIEPELGAHIFKQAFYSLPSVA